MAVSSPWEGIGKRPGAGVVHVLFGTAAGLTSSESQMWSQNSRGVPGTANGGEFAGHSLAAADFGRDGHDDLAIGIWGKSNSTKSAFGAVLVLYGSHSGLGSAGSQAWSQDSRGIKGGADERSDW